MTPKRPNICTPWVSLPEMRLRFARSDSTDPILSAGDVHADEIGACRCAGRVRADEATQDGSLGAEELDTTAIKALDHEAFDNGLKPVELQAVRADAGVDAVKHDLQDAVVTDGKRVRRGSGLAVSRRSLSRSRWSARGCGAMTFEELVILKLIVSALGVLFASWIAARNVHCLPVAVDVSHLPLPMLLSAASPVLLTTKMLAASTGGAARQCCDGGRAHDQCDRDEGRPALLMPSAHLVSLGPVQFPNDPDWDRRSTRCLCDCRRRAGLEQQEAGALLRHE